MRYYSYYHSNTCQVDTVSEDDIRRTFWPSWYNKMCEQYEQAYVDETYCFEDCLEHWVIKHRAWPVTI